MIELKKIDQLAWRKFLGSESGMKGLLWLRTNEPKIKKGESHQMIHDGGVVNGYRLAIDALSDVIGREENQSVDVENK